MKRFFFLILLIFIPILTSASECPVGTYQVSSHPRSDYYRKDGTHVSSTVVTTYCREYLYFKPLKEKFDNDIPKNWPHKKEKFKEWLKSEKKQISDILKKLPKSLTQIGNLSLRRAFKSESAGNPSTCAPTEHIIVFYDDISKYNYPKVLTHELAHILYESLPEEQKNSYQKAAQWNGDPVQGFRTSRTQFSEKDGIIGPDEDFANNVEHLLSDSDPTKIIEKDILDCLKKILGKTK